MKSGTCSGSTPVALDHLGRVDAVRRVPAGARREHRDRVGHELVGVAVGRDDQRPPARLGLEPRRRREEVVGLVPRPLGPCEPERFAQLRHPVELLQDLGVELAAGLVLGPLLVPVGRHRQRVPAREHRPRLLGPPQPHRHDREPVQGVDRPSAGARQRPRAVVGAMGERVAVEHEERARGHGHRRYTIGLVHRLNLRTERREEMVDITAAVAARCRGARGRRPARCSSTCRTRPPP